MFLNGNESFLEKQVQSHSRSRRNRGGQVRILRTITKFAKSCKIK